MAKRHALAAANALGTLHGTDPPRKHIDCLDRTCRNAGTATNASRGIDPCLPAYFVCPFH